MEDDLFSERANAKQILTALTSYFTLFAIDFVLTPPVSIDTVGATPLHQTLMHTIRDIVRGK